MSIFDERQNEWHKVGDAEIGVFDGRTLVYFPKSREMLCGGTRGDLPEWLRIVFCNSKEIISDAWAAELARRNKPLEWEDKGALKIAANGITTYLIQTLRLNGYCASAIYKNGDYEISKTGISTEDAIDWCEQHAKAQNSR